MIFHSASVTCTDINHPSSENSRRASTFVSIHMSTKCVKPDFLFGAILTTWLDSRVMCSSKTDNSFAVPRLIGSNDFCLAVGCRWPQFCITTALTESGLSIELLIKTFLGNPVPTISNLNHLNSFRWSSLYTLPRLIFMLVKNYNHMYNHFVIGKYIYGGSDTRILFFRHHLVPLPHSTKNPHRHKYASSVLEQSTKKVKESKS